MVQINLFTKESQMWKTILRLLRWGGIIGRLGLTYTNIYKIGIAQKTLYAVMAYTGKESKNQWLYVHG